MFRERFGDNSIKDVKTTFTFFTTNFGIDNKSGDEIDLKQQRLAGHYNISLLFLKYLNYFSDTLEIYLKYLNHFSDISQISKLFL